MVWVRLLGFNHSGDSNNGENTNHPCKQHTEGFGDELAVERLEPASLTKGGISADQVGLARKPVLCL